MALPPRPGPLALLVFLTLAALGAVAFQLMGPPSTRETIEAARDSLRVLRSEAEACRAGIRQGEVEFRDYQGEVAALRERIRNLESLHPDGVPGDSYAIYLEVVNTFNLAVPDWSDRVDTLQAGWASCRNVVEAHNVMADSLQRLLDAEGIAVPTRVPPPGGGSDFRPGSVRPEWERPGGS